MFTFSIHRFLFPNYQAAWQLPLPAKISQLSACVLLAGETCSPVWVFPLWLGGNEDMSKARACSRSCRKWDASAERGRDVVTHFGISQKAAVLTSGFSPYSSYHSMEGKRLKIKPREIISGKLLHSIHFPSNHIVSPKCHTGVLRHLCHLLLWDNLDSQIPLCCSFSLPLNKTTKKIKPTNQKKKPPPKKSRFSLYSPTSSVLF